MINQCDGCRRGAPLSPNGKNHKLYPDHGGYPGEVMGCTKHLYEEKEQQKGKEENEMCSVRRTADTGRSEK